MNQPTCPKCDGAGSTIIVGPNLEPYRVFCDCDIGRKAKEDYIAERSAEIKARIDGRSKWQT